MTDSLVAARQTFLAIAALTFVLTLLVVALVRGSPEAQARRQAHRRAADREARLRARGLDATIRDGGAALR